MLSIRSSIVHVIVLGYDTPVPRRMLGIPALQLLLHLSADKIFIRAKSSASASVKLRMDRSARLHSWVLEGSAVYEILEVG